MRKMIAGLILSVLAGLARGETTTPQTVTVLIGDFFYFPPVVTVNAGDTVEWINISGAVSHTVTNDAGLFNSGLIPPGDAVSLVFPARGVFTYHSEFYFSVMVGAVVVNSPGTPALSLVTDPNLFAGTTGLGAFPISPGYIPTASGTPLLGSPGASITGVFPIQTEVGTLFGGSNESSGVGAVSLPTNPNIINTAIQSGNTSILQTGNLLVAQGVTAAITVAGSPTGTVAAQTAASTQTVQTSAAVTSQTSAPVIISAATDSAFTGMPHRFVISAMNSPTQFTAVGLPVGLTLNTLTGEISGTPSVAGDSDVIVTASNDFGAAISRLEMTVVNPQPPNLQIPLSVNAIMGVPFNFALSSEGTAPIVFSTSTLPPGLYLSTDHITGIPTQAGSFVVAVNADNIAGDSAATLTITVADPLAGGDTDGDGFPDDFELTLGSNPLDPNSTPYGISANPSLPINLQVLSIKLNFASSGHDTIQLSGTIPYQPAATGTDSLAVDIDGAIQAFSLNPSGKGQIGQDTAFLKQVPQLHAARITINLHNSSIVAALNRHGLDGSRDIRTGTKQIDVMILVGHTLFKTTQTVKFQAHVNSSGMAKM